MKEILGKIHIHPLFWLTFFLGVITANFLQTLLLFLMVFIHEMGHVTICVLFGWKIKQVQLLPFGGVAEVDEHGNRPLYEELLVYLAGPLQHVWLHFLIGQLPVEPQVMSFLYGNNMGLFIFNLLPIWPLDGGRLLFTCLSYWYPFKKAHAKTLVFSLASLLFFMGSILFFTPRNVTMWCMIFFLSISIYLEWNQRTYIFHRFLLHRYQMEKPRKLRKKIFTKEEPIFSLLAQFHKGHEHILFLGQHIWTEEQMLHIYFKEPRQ